MIDWYSWWNGFVVGLATGWFTFILFLITLKLRQAK